MERSNGSERKRSTRITTTLGVAAVLLAAAPDAHAALGRLESRCLSTVARAAGKLAKVELKLLGKCRRDVAAGKSTGSCPSALVAAKIDSLVERVGERAVKSCGSTCSISTELECLSDLQCPPLGTAGEGCTAGVSGREFDMDQLGLPGPYCKALLGGPIEAAIQIGQCVAAGADGAVQRLMDTTYGVQAGATFSKSAASCVNAAADAVAKLAVVVFKGVSRCRDRINRGLQVTNAATCADDDARLAKKIVKAEARVRSAVLGSCTTTDLSELPACGTANVAASAECWIALGRDASDPLVVPGARRIAGPSLVEAAYPPSPICGDGVVNQLPGAFLPIGEECDGGDDSACPGACLPPGDLFECTCADVARMRLFTDASISEIDTGWTGLSHDQPLGDLGGFVTDLVDCDCTSVIDGACVGQSLDPVCAVRGRQLPVCSTTPAATVRCDAAGNANGLDENADCWICDAASANAGVFCRDDSGCQSLCYDGNGSAGSACTKQSDCGSDEICRGRCDRRPTCLVQPNGGPHPVSAAGVAVCAVQTFRTDVSGTRNLLTGEHQLSYRQFSRIHLGETSRRPCPVCGGFCTGGGNALEVCHGRCELSGDPCRFDADCSPADTCSDESPDCPGGRCQLSLVCGADPAINPSVAGKPCRIDFEHEVFGTLSSDCPPAATLNISGAGLEIDYLPSATTASLAATLPCTGAGLGLYDCPCPDDGAQPTAPNACTPACNAGLFFGTGCADGAGSGAGTTCAAGANGGLLCDEDADCPGSSCSQNPNHCLGDPAYERKACTSNADCGLGTCVDACPGGRCVPLCVPSGGEIGEAHCAAGPPVYHCDGAKLSFLACSPSAASAGCSATCKSSGQACGADADCAPGDSCAGSCPKARDCEAGGDGVLGTADDTAGAGMCVADVRQCFMDPIVAVGGEILPGLGPLTSHDSVAVWCMGATQNGGINASAGFGGPGRIHLRGLNVPNFTSIPPDLP